MFVSDPNLNELRQGDILHGLYYPESGIKLVLDGAPIEPFEGSRALTAAIEPDGRQFQWVPGKIRYLVRGYVIVLSQCCDLELKGRLPKAHAIVLAPLLDIPPTILGDQEKLAKLQANDVRDYTNYFHIAQKSPLTSDCVVNLNRLFSMSNGTFSELVSRKRLEMTIEARFALKTKLQYNFSRPAGDDNHLYPTAS